MEGLTLNETLPPVYDRIYYMVGLPAIYLRHRPKLDFGEEILRILTESLAEKLGLLERRSS